MARRPTPTFETLRARYWPETLRGKAIAGGVLLLVVGVVIYSFSGSSQERQRRAGGRFGEGGPVPVLTAPAKRADVPVVIEAVGTTRALNTVTVRAQVEGKLLSVGFKEGQDVKKGDVLAIIDPVTFQAQYDQAVGKKAQDEATLANARTDLERYERLSVTNSINRQQLDTQRATVRQLEALVQSDQAAIDSARAILGYTKIVAPIDGRAGLRQVDEGNIARASDANGIVTITQLKPISVFFNLPQQDLPRVNAAFQKEPLTVEALQSDTGAVIDRGALVVVDNQVDQTTGTVRMKAEFPNEQLQLWPGQFVNVRLTIDILKQVTVIPTGAVQRGPNGTFVYVIINDKALVRPVQVTQQDETQAVVSTGVNPEETVVTTGFARLTDNATVTLAAAGDGNARPERRRREGGGRRDNAEGRGGEGGERRERGNSAPGTAPNSGAGSAPAPQ